MSVYTKQEQQQLIKARIACFEAGYPASEAQFGCIAEWEKHNGFTWKWHAENTTLTPHPYADVIKAWANGEIIQCYLPITDKWVDIHDQSVCWLCPNTKFRVKPDRKPDRVIDLLLEKRPGFAPFIYASMDEYTGLPARTWQHNIKATFDGETDQLIKVELI